MGKEGPCFHCGINSTPLWRNGPMEKPVLCNACGSRWRVQGTLTDYIPKHVIDLTSPLKIGSMNGSPKSTSAGTGTLLPKVSKSPVPKRKRTVQQARILSPIERFHRQLYCLSQEPQFSKLHEEQEENILIYHKSSNLDPNEIGLGVVQLQPPQSPNNDSN